MSYNDRVQFHVCATDGRARAGSLTTSHNVIETPIFMPVGTRGSVRTQTLDQIEATGAPIILGNTYHLSVRPVRSCSRHAERVPAPDSTTRCSRSGTG